MSKLGLLEYIVLRIDKEAGTAVVATSFDNIYKAVQYKFQQEALDPKHGYRVVQNINITMMAAGL